MRPRSRRGFTLVELLLAVGLLSILILALLRLVDTSLTIWGRTDENRELAEISNAVMELLADDVHALEGGPRGDLLADWVLLDLDRDGIQDAPHQRLRLVRSTDPAGMQRVQQDQEGGAAAEVEVFERGRLEVAWALLRSGDDAEEATGVLLRGERLVGDKERVSFFDPNFFGPNGKPLPGSLHELTAGVLWFDLWFASQTSVVHDGWRLGSELSDCAASWDAWRKERPNAEVSVLNRPASGMPTAKDVPLLPRRVRIELELERPADLVRRTRLALEIGEATNVLEVRDGRKLPPAGRLVRIGDEWMTVLSVVENRVSVERGRRATRATAHAAGELVHHGWPSVREVTVDITREDWDL